MRRLMSIEMFLRRSPSTLPSSVMICRIRRTSSSVRSLIRRFTSTSAFDRIRFERERPIPKMYVRPISTRLFCGRSTPAIRATVALPPCHPWRCLCFGLSQITRITPRLLTILHLSQILFTEALTFMASSLVPVDDAAPAEVVRRQLDQDAIARQDPDEVLPHLAGDVGEDAVLVVQLDAEHR